MAGDGGRWTITETPDREAWAACLAGEPTGDFLQSWAWAEAGSASGETWRRLAALRPDGTIDALAQVQIVRAGPLGRRSAYLPHGPVWRRDGPAGRDAVTALLGHVLAMARAERLVSVVLDPRTGLTGLPGDDPGPVIDQLTGVRPPRPIQMDTTRVVDLDPTDIHATWDKQARNLGRRGHKEGVTTEVLPGTDRAAVGTLHDLLVEVGARGGFQPRPRSFLTAYGRAADVFVVLASHQKRVIAGALIGVVGDRAYYQFAGSLREDALKHANAAYVVMERVFQEAAARGLATLDLCGVNDPDDPGADPRWEGLSIFKRGFGGRYVHHPLPWELVTSPRVHRALALARSARSRVRRG